MPKSKESLNEILYDLKRIEEHRAVLTEEKITKIYKSLVKDLNAYLGDEYIKYADGDGRLFLASLQSKRQYARFLDEVVARVDSITPQVKKEISDLVDKTYAACYEGMADAVNNAKNTQEVAAIMGDSIVRPEVLSQAIDNNISKLTLPSVMEMHRADIIYQIKRELTTGLMNGDRYEKMAERITERLDVSRGKANNIVRTESHRNIECGMMDCAKDIATGLEGSGLVYTATWRTMGDQRVRPNRLVKTKKGWKKTYSKNGANHVKMDGVTIKVGDKFKLEAGVYAECPSASGVARHDCNCRCTIVYDLMTAEEFAALENKQENKFVNGQSVSNNTRAIMNKNGIADLGLERTADAERFDSAIIAAKEANPHGGAVDTHEIEELQTFSLFLSSNGMAGVAVKPDGDITGVFKNSEWKQRGAVYDLILTARANGGVKMDCYGVGLVNMYERCGYVPVARVPFNPDYVSDPVLLRDRPDVYVMMKNTDDLPTAIKKSGAKAYRLSAQEELDALPTMEYDDALAYRDGLLQNQQ